MLVRYSVHIQVELGVESMCVHLMRNPAQTLLASVAVNQMKQRNGPDALFSSGEKSRKKDPEKRYVGLYRTVLKLINKNLLVKTKKLI